MSSTFASGPVAGEGAIVGETEASPTQLPATHTLHAIAFSATREHQERQQQQQQQLRHSHHHHHQSSQDHEVPPESRESYRRPGSPLSSTQATISSAQRTLQILQAATAAAPPASLPAIQDLNGEHPQQDRHQHHYATIAPTAQVPGQHSAIPYPVTATAYPSAHSYDDSIPPQHLRPAQSPPPHNMGVAPKSSKQTRLRRACDMCSARKVKCDEAGPPCQPCSVLNVDCTYQREMKRRGPRNKHAEAAKAAKRARLEPAVSWPSDAPAMISKLSSSPSAVPAAAAAAEAASDPIQYQTQVVEPQQSQTQPQQQPLDADFIAPWPTLGLLVDDFFTYIHPLIPFPHEPSFRRSFEAREDRTNPEFLALLASMIGSLVASFPRAARLHLKSQRDADLFPRAIVMVERCRDVALLARGHAFVAKDKHSTSDAATSYFLGIAAGYTMHWRICRRFLSECLSMVRELGFHRPRRTGPTVLGAAGIDYDTPSRHQLNHIDDQVGKRMFWVVMVGIRSMVQLGASHSEIPLAPPTPTDPYPEMPVEVDDEYITEDEIHPQPPGTVSQLTGFNAGIRIYMTMNPLVSVELSYGIESLSLKEQESLLSGCIHAAKHATDNLPPELCLSVDLARSRNQSPGPNNSGNPDGAAAFDFPTVQGPPQDIFDDAPGYRYFPPAYPNQQPANDVRHVFSSQPGRRKLLQFEIQKSNIYVSLMSTISYYVERCFALRDAYRPRDRCANGGTGGKSPAAGSSPKVADPGGDQLTVAKVNNKADEFAIERERVVQNLLAILASITQRNMEPNGPSLINKIRQVASTLLADAPERKGPVAVKSEAALKHFVDILIRLEKTSGPGSGGAGRYAAVAAEPADAAENGAGIMTPMDEEEELRTWADLREFQIRFAQEGGFLGGL